MYAKWLCLAAVTTTVTFPNEARATVVRALTLQEKAQIATHVVRAEVLNVESQWLLEGGSVQTLVQLRVLESLKGALGGGDRFTIRLVGGKIGEFVHKIEGMDVFMAGKEHVLFLERFQDWFVPIGIGIAKYDISLRSGGKWITQRPGVMLAESTESGMQIRPAKEMQPERLNSFLSKVKQHIHSNDLPVRSPKKAKQKRLSAPGQKS